MNPNRWFDQQPEDPAQSAGDEDLGTLPSADGEPSANAPLDQSAQASDMIIGDQGSGEDAGADEGWQQ